VPQGCRCRGWRRALDRGLPSVESLAERVGRWFWSERPGFAVRDPVCVPVGPDRRVPRSCFLRCKRLVVRFRGLPAGEWLGD
jgi:hypothetical protein